MSDEQVTTDDGVAYADMPWQKLKALMTAENQEWVNAEHAIEYLTALDNADADESTESEKAEPSQESGEESLDSENNPDPEGSQEQEGNLNESEPEDESDRVDQDELVPEPEDDSVRPVLYPVESYGVLVAICFSY